MAEQLTQDLETQDNQQMTKYSGPNMAGIKAQIANKPVTLDHDRLYEGLVSITISSR